MVHEDRSALVLYAGLCRCDARDMCQAVKKCAQVIVPGDDRAFKFRSRYEVRLQSVKKIVRYAPDTEKSRI